MFQLTNHCLKRFQQRVDPEVTRIWPVVRDSQPIPIDLYEYFGPGIQHHPPDSLLYSADYQVIFVVDGGVVKTCWKATRSQIIMIERRQRATG